MNVLSRAGFGVWNGYAPSQGPKAMPYTFDFSDTDTIIDDLLTENTRGDMQFVQGIYVDNSDNPHPFTITFGITNQRIVVPANAQGLWPVMAPDQTQFKATTNQGVKVFVLFLNVPTAYTQWGPTTVNANVDIKPFSGTLTDFSGTVAAPATSQQLFAANANAVRRTVQNPATNNESIWISFGGNAATDGTPSIEIGPGSSFDTGSGPIDQSEWTVIAVDSVPYTAWEMA